MNNRELATKQLSGKLKALVENWLIDNPDNTVEDACDAAEWLCEELARWSVQITAHESQEFENE